ncbi:MAG: hypothetical protein J5496_05505 [Lachnospiraceae bacterium]|nr:hypothetical protein [Lachnospiraceae bacterium]
MKRGILKVLGAAFLIALAMFFLLPNKAMAEEKNGWVQENGRWRYYSDGYMYRNQGLGEYNGDEYASLYWFDDEGYMVTGFYKTEGGDGYYLSYFGPDGKRWSKNGWQKMDGYWYYISNGYVCAGKNGYFMYEKNSLGLYTIDGAVYGFDEFGHMVTGWVLAEMTVWKTVYYGEYQETVPVFDENGEQLTENRWYYFEANGKAVSGWVKRDADWFYFYQGRATAGDVYEIGDKKYCFDEEGVMQTNKWIKHESSDGTMKWYYFGSNGAMAKDCWMKISGKWYYFEGENYVTGWKKISDKWYYFNAGGDMVTGWKKIGSKWYFFKPSGVMAAKEWYDGYWLGADGAWTYTYKASWKKNASGWWYGDTSGWYAKNCTIMINDKLYTFNANGYWVP